jgi:hypothetical protein
MGRNYLPSSYNIMMADCYICLEEIRREESPNIFSTICKCPKNYHKKCYEEMKRSAKLLCAICRLKCPIEPPLQHHVFSNLILVNFEVDEWFPLELWVMVNMTILNFLFMYLYTHLYSPEVIYPLIETVLTCISMHFTCIKIILTNREFGDCEQVMMNMLGNYYTMLYFMGILTVRRLCMISFVFFYKYLFTTFSMKFLSFMAEYICKKVREFREAFPVGRVHDD